MELINYARMEGEKEGTYIKGNETYRLLLHKRSVSRLEKKRNILIG